VSHHLSAEPATTRKLLPATAVAVLAIAALVPAGLLAYSIAAVLLPVALFGAFLYDQRSDLTRRSVAIVLIGIASYLFAWNRGVPLLFAFSAACFALVVVAHVMPRRVLRPVQARIGAPNWILQGDAADIALAVENPTRRALRLLEVEVKASGSIEATEPARALIMRLAGEGREHIAIATPPLKRGLQTIGPVIVSTGYPLGLVNPALTLEGTQRRLWVYPRLFPVERLELEGASFQLLGEAISPRGGGDDAFAGVREYRHGDARRHIHWRASARHGQMVVKEFMRTTATTVTIALDLSRRGGMGEGIDTATEYGVSIAGSIARYALSQGHHVQLLLCGQSVERVGPVGRTSDLDRLLRTLALARAEGEKRFGEHLGRIDALTPIQSTAVLIYLDGNAGWLAGIESLRSKGCLVLPIVIDAASFEHPGKQSRTVRSASAFRKVRRGDNLAGLFRS